MINEDEILISDENGNEKVMKILFTYNNEVRNKDYVFVYEVGSEDDVMAFVYNEATKSLQEIDDEEEYNEVEEVFNAFLEDPKINEIKN